MLMDILELIMAKGSGYMRFRPHLALIGILTLSIIIIGCQPTSGYQLITNLERLPDQVRSWAEAYSRIFAGTSMSDDKYTYVLISTGPAADPQQKINILDIREEEGKLIVEVDLAGEVSDTAQPGQNYSYPFALARLPKTQLPVEFRSTVNSELWIPRVIGVPEGWLPFAGPEGEVTYSERRPQIVLGAMPPKPGVYNDVRIIEGLARVFEATVEQDWVINGIPHNHSFTTAAAGAPDWGFFRFELEPLRGSTDLLRIYSTSAKDGSIENLVTVKTTGAR